MRPHVIIISATVLAATAGAWWLLRPMSGSPEGGAIAPAPSMHERLREIAERTPDDNIFVGSANARELRRALECLPDSTPWLERVALLGESAAAELRLGNVRHSTALYEELLQYLAAHAARPSDLVKWLFEAGIAYLQLAERQNCCYQTSPDSCIFPIRGDGIHRHREGAQKAASCFEKVVQLTHVGSQRRDSAIWLLNIAHMTLGSWPEGLSAGLALDIHPHTSHAPFPRFYNISSKLGLDGYNLSGGAVVEDLDGDGLLDVLTSSWDPTVSMRCYHRVADGTFREVTSEVGLLGILGGLNLVPADYDNDGDVDVLVLRGGWLGSAGRHPNSLLRNDGKGHFDDVTIAAGLANHSLPTQTAAWADYDGDGDLDLYIGNESTPDMTAPNELFRNDGDGTFTDVAPQAGVANLRWSKGVGWGDIDNDGDPDLYVSNLSGPNRLYRNLGNGTFTDIAPQEGVEGPRLSFPMWFWDYDNDGFLDIYVPSYEARISDFAAHYAGGAPTCEQSHLYHNDGQGRFEDRAIQMGLIQPVRPMGSNFGDLDGDGRLDIYLGNGDPLYESLMPNQLFRNAGTHFEDVTVASGLGHLQKGHGIAFADFDQDGDLDIFSMLGGAFKGDKFLNAFYENPGFQHHWLAIEVEGRRSNRSGIGVRLHARIVDTDGTERSIRKCVNSGGSFGASPLRQTLGLGKARRLKFLEVHWPTTGKTQRFESVAMDQGVRVVEGQPELIPLALAKLPLRGAR